MCYGICSKERQDGECTLKKGESCSHDVADDIEDDETYECIHCGGEVHIDSAGDYACRDCNSFSSERNQIIKENKK